MAKLHTLRGYEGEEDYWRIRVFLREVYLRNQRRDLSWQTARLDYWRWHVNENIFKLPLEAIIFIWEMPDGRIAGVLNTESMGEASLQIHPEFRDADLESEMLRQAELCLPSVEPDGERKLIVWAHAIDQDRQKLLEAHGYVKGEWPEYQWQRSLDVPIPDAPPPAGYEVRSLGTVDELPARSWISWRAFHPDEPDANYQGWEWYHNIQRMPMYRRDLDLVAATSSGELAGFCTIWYDDVTRTGMFEPVGIVPEHQQRGLGTALMCEGLRRLKRLGGTLATVAGYSPAANALYSGVMSPEYLLVDRWEKTSF